MATAKISMYTLDLEVDEEDDGSCNGSVMGHGSRSGDGRIWSQATTKGVALFASRGDDKRVA